MLMKNNTRVIAGVLCAAQLLGCGGGGGGSGSGSSGGGGSNPPGGGQVPVLQADAPKQVAFGESVEFTVTAMNAGSTPFKLLYGPAGMSVSPSGKVSWRAVLPMLSNSTDVKYGIGMGESKLALMTTVVDAARKPPLSITGDQFPQRDGGLVLSDLNHDGHTSVLVAGNVGIQEYAWDGTRYSARWNRAFTSDPSDIAIAAANVSGDPSQEIFVSVANRILRLDGATREQNGELDLPAQEYCDKLLVADLNADGSMELVCSLIVKDHLVQTQTASTLLDAPAILVIDAATMKVDWRGEEFEKLETVRTGLAIGNVDSDPALEIVTGWGAVIDGSSFQTEWQNGDEFGTVVAVGDLTGDGVAEIVGGGRFAEATVFSALTQSAIGSIALPNAASPHSVFISDVDGDGVTDLLIADGEDQSHIHLYHYSGGAFVHITSLDANGYLVSALAVGDTDNDDVPELVWGTDIGSSLQDKLVVAHVAAAPAVEWMSDGDAMVNPPFFGGQSVRTAQGDEQLVFGAAGDNSFGSSANRLVSVDPDLASISVLGTFASVPSGFAMSIGDYDGDGLDEIVHGSGDSYDGSVSVFDIASRTDEWSSAVLGLAGLQSHVTASADVNGDSFLDVITLGTGSPAGTRIRVLDVQHNEMLWESDALDGSPVDLALARASNGQFDIVVATSGHLFLFSPAPTGGYVQRATRAMPLVLDLLAADLTGDGVDEIYYLIEVQDALNPAKVGQVDRTLSTVIEWRRSEAVTAIAAEDFPGVSEPRNIVLSSPARLTIIDPATGDEVWRTSAIDNEVEPNRLFFFGTADRPRLSFGSSGGIFVSR